MILLTRTAVRIFKFQVPVLQKLHHVFLIAYFYQEQESMTNEQKMALRIQVPRRKK